MQVLPAPTFVLSQCSFAVYMCLLVFWSVCVCSVCSRVCVHELALALEMRNPVVVLTDSRGTKQSSSATLSGNRPYMALIGWVCFLFALGACGRGAVRPTCKLLGVWGASFHRSLCNLAAGCLRIAGVERKITQPALRSISERVCHLCLTQ